MPAGARLITTTKVPGKKEMAGEERSDIWMKPAFRIYLKHFNRQWLEGKRLFPTVMEMEPRSQMSQPLPVVSGHMLSGDLASFLLPSVNKTENYTLHETRGVILTKSKLGLLF